jgi:hypothetical protein
MGFIDLYFRFHFLRHGEAPPGYSLQVLARSSLWAFRYYPLPNLSYKSSVFLIQSIYCAPKNSSFDWVCLWRALNPSPLNPRVKNPWLLTCLPVRQALNPAGVRGLNRTTYSKIPILFFF